MSLEEEAPAAKLWTSASWPFILSTLLLMTLIAFEFFAVTTVLPVVAADLGGTAWYSLAAAATVSTGLIGMIVGGNWADRSGTSRPLTVGGALFLGGVALCTLAPSMAAFILGRLLQGIGGGVNSVVLYVLIAQLVPDDARPKMFGLLSAAWVLPSMLGPVAAGALADLSSWRMVFAMVFAGSLAALSTLLWQSRQSPAVQRSGTAVFGRRGLLAVLASATLVMVHVGGQQEPWLAAVVVPAGVLILALAALRLLPAGTFRMRLGVPRFIGLRALLGAVGTASEVYLVLYMQQHRDIAPSIAGLVIAVAAGGWAVGAWLQSRKPGEPGYDRRIIAAGCLMVLAGPVVNLLYVWHVAPMPAVFLASVATGAGFGLAYPRLTTATLRSAAPEQRGTASSSLQAGENMATSAFLALTGIVLTLNLTSPWFGGLYVIMVCLATLTAAAAFGLKASHR
ncbi:MFS transporter [Nesterenkonia muleiensis]|uniref:MFS transporter n=1 Tax=Nesterenkonia muleiensis TaxID=2282648 RepID=UPI000E756BF6|nr:MFS transporter [Nesterenkonia muleiensis]